MLSVVIETQDDEDGLARTLTSLVGGAIEGVVREVVVYDRGSRDGTAKVAEHAGCHFLDHGDFMQAVAMAKADWLLFVEPGARLLDGWMAPVMAHCAVSALPMRFTVSSGHARVSLLAKVFPRGRRLAAGLLVPKKLALAKNPAGSEALAGSLSTRRLGALMVAAPSKKAGR